MATQGDLGSSKFMLVVLRVVEDEGLVIVRLVLEDGRMGVGVALALLGGVFVEDGKTGTAFSVADVGCSVEDGCKFVLLPLLLLLLGALALLLGIDVGQQDCQSF
jgi:hypothetical protein